MPLIPFSSASRGSRKVKPEVPAAISSRTRLDEYFSGESLSCHSGGVVHRGAVEVIPFLNGVTGVDADPDPNRGGGTAEDAIDFVLNRLCASDRGAPA